MYAIISPQMMGLSAFRLNVVQLKVKQMRNEMAVQHYSQSVCQFYNSLLPEIPCQFSDENVITLKFFSLVLKHGDLKALG